MREKNIFCPNKVLLFPAFANSIFLKYSLADFNVFYVAYF